MDDSDASALVEAALQHDDEAARALVRQLYPLVAKVVRAHRPRRTAEEDLCQMIFIKVFQKLSQFSGKVPLEHWVSRIAVNTCLNQIESAKFRQKKSNERSENRSVAAISRTGRSRSSGSDAVWIRYPGGRALAGRCKEGERSTTFTAGRCSSIGGRHHHIDDCSAT